MAFSDRGIENRLIAEWHLLKLLRLDEINRRRNETHRFCRALPGGRIGGAGL